MRNWILLNLTILLTLFFTCKCQTLVLVGPCSTASSVTIGDTCSFQLSLQTDVAVPTSVSILIDTNLMGQLYKPLVKAGSNYNLSSMPIPQLSSKYNTSQVY